MEWRGEAVTTERISPGSGRGETETETLPSPPCRGGTGTRRSGVTSARRGRPREKGRVEKKT